MSCTMSFRGSHVNYVLHPSISPNPFLHSMNRCRLSIIAIDLYVLSHIYLVTVYLLKAYSYFPSEEMNYDCLCARTCLENGLSVTSTSVNKIS